MPHYESVNGIARKVVKRYEPVDLVFRNVLSAYESVNGVSRKVFGGIPFPYTVNFWLQGASTTPRTIHEWFRGKSDGMWRFYLDTEGSTTNTSNPVSCVADIEGDLSNKQITLVCKAWTTSANVLGADNIKLIYRQNGSWVTYYEGTIIDLRAEDFTTFSTIMPSGVDMVRVGVWQSYKGRTQSELLINSFKVDGVELVY